jgi:phosphoglycerate dehydrogenase-like enzyme
VRLLLSERAAASFGAQIAAVDPTLELVTMSHDGSLVASGAPVPAGDVPEIEVAWLTVDLLEPGRPIRPFLGLVRRMPSLRWFQSAAAGTDEPYFAELGRRGVRVSVSHVNAVAIAEYVLRAALDYAQDAGQWRMRQAAASWATHDFDELAGSRWLVLGTGAIGSGVASRVAGFEVTTVGVRRHPRGDEPFDLMLRPDQLLAALPEADVVVLAAPATEETRGIVDATFLAAMKPGSLLVNVARGSLVDEAALLGALETGPLGGAALDVFATEPLPADHPFWHHPKVAVTPHNAAKGHGRYRRAAQLFCENLSRYLAGDPLLHEVPPDQLGP